MRLTIPRQRLPVRDNGTSLMLASLRFLNTFGEQRHRRSRLHAPLSYRGPLDDDSYAAETASLDRDPLLIHDVSILPSELTDVVRYAKYHDTHDSIHGCGSLWVVVLRCSVGNHSNFERRKILQLSEQRFYHSLLGFGHFLWIEVFGGWN